MESFAFQFPEVAAAPPAFRRPCGRFNCFPFPPRPAAIPLGLPWAATEAVSQPAAEGANLQRCL